MAEKVITFKVKVLDESGNIVEKTVNNIKDLEKSVSDLEKEVKGTELGSEAFKELNSELKKSKDALDEAKASTQSLGERFSSIPGPIGSVAKGVQGLGTAFKALIANPIGLVLAAIAVALTTLYKAFTSTKAGAEKMEQVMAGVGAVLDVLRDRVLKVGGAIVKFLSGDFSGAADDLKGAFSGIGEEIASEFNQAMALKQELQAIDDATRELNNTRAEQNKLIAEAKLKINDENLSYEERQKALEEVRTAEIALAKQEEALAQRRYEAIKAQNALSDSSKEALDAEAQAYQALQQAQQASAQKQKELFDQEKALRDKARADRKAAADERKRQAEAVAKVEQDLMLALITDEEEKAKKSAELAYQAQLKEIDGLKTSTAKKNELKLQAEQAYQIAVEKLDEDAKKKREEKEKADQDKIDADNQQKYDAEVKRLEGLMKLEELRMEDGQIMTEEDLMKKLELQRQYTEKLLENDKLTDEERKLIQTEFDNFVEASTKARVDAENELERTKLQASANALGQLAEIAGKESAFGKAAAVAQATINTYLSASEAYKSLVGIPVVGPAVASIAAAAAVVAGLKSIQQITAVKLPETPKMAYGGLVGGYGLGTEDNQLIQASAGEAVMTKKAVDLFGPTLSAMNQLGGGRSFNGGLVSAGADQTQVELLNAMKNNGRRPVQAFVVSSQMENEAQFDRAVKSRSLI